MFLRQVMKGLRSGIGSIEVDVPQGQTLNADKWKVTFYYLSEAARIFQLVKKGRLLIAYLLRSHARLSSYHFCKVFGGYLYGN